MIAHSQKKGSTNGFLKPDSDALVNTSFAGNSSLQKKSGVKAPISGGLYSFGDLPLFASNKVVQPKLSVNTPGDKYEREADAVANKVVQNSGNNINAQASRSQGINTSSTASGPVGVFVSPELSDKISSTQGAGKMMDKETGNFMSQQLGADLSDVKIHTGDDAVKMNNSLSAKAFTAGRDIYFNSGQYNPFSTEGKRLLAHELVHTQQQSGNTAAPIMRTPSDDAKALGKKLHDALTATVVDKKAVLGGLATLNRDQTKASLLKTEYKTAYTKELEDDLKLKLSGNDLSRALFLLNAPPAEKTMVNEATVEKAGTEDHKAKVGGGVVSVHTGVDYKPQEGGTTRVGGFSMGYTGTDTAESRFIQTIWSEVVSTQPDKSETMVNKTGLGTSNGTMDLTTDITKPKYKIDSGSPTSPFYESGFRNVRTKDGNINYDKPDPFTGVVVEQFDNGATKVVERDHFDGFLIKENKVVYQVSLVVEWVYTSKTAVTKSTKFGKGAAITTLPAAVRKQLLVEYPKFEYIQ